MPGFALIVATVAVFVILVASFIAFIASRYKRCPSDMVLVVFGKVGTGQSARCIHGGGTFVWPLIQDFRYMSLTPLTIMIPLKNALSKQNIRIDVPSTFTVGISTHSAVMPNAAERLLGMGPKQIELMAGEIIFGQLRLTVASLTIEEINKDRERFLESIRQNVEPELNKIGLYLINVNVTDITDESNYITSIGKKAASQAVNQAKIDVSEQIKLGSIGESEALREMQIRVAQNQNESEKGIKQAESDRRVFVQQQEAAAVKGEKEAEAERRVFVQQQEAEAVMGEKKAEAERRVFVQQQEADAVKGENLAKGEIASFEADLAIRRAEMLQRSEVANRLAVVEIQKAEYQAQAEKLRAEKVVQQEIAKRMTEIDADAAAEKTRRLAKGEADAVLMNFEAQAEGVRKMLDSKALGYQKLIQSCGGDAKAAATLLLVEKLESIVRMQVDAIRNLKIDKITVWDSGNGAAAGGSNTANFLSGLVRSLPPLQEISKMAGVELPEYLGRLTPEKAGTEAAKPGPAA